MRHLPTILLSPLLLVAACASGPGISPVPSSTDLYHLVRQGSSSLQQGEGLATEGRTEAANFCEMRNATLEVVDVQTSTTWNATGNVPVFKMRFRCVPRPVRDTQAAQPMPK
jgi:hypothetical protein